MAFREEIQEATAQIKEEGKIPQTNIKIFEFNTNLLKSSDRINDATSEEISAFFDFLFTSLGQIKTLKEIKILNNYNLDKEEILSQSTRHGIEANVTFK